MEELTRAIHTGLIDHSFFEYEVSSTFISQ